jgi:hypothetical protein
MQVLSISSPAFLCECTCHGLHVLALPGCAHGIVYRFPFRIATVCSVDCSVIAGILPALFDIELHFLCRSRPFHEVRFPFTCSQFRCYVLIAQPIPAILCGWPVHSHVLGGSLFARGLLLEASHSNARRGFLLLAQHSNHAGCRM